MLAYSSVGQAGYMLAGVVVATRLGVQATVLYLIVYLMMNIAAFAVIVARERETGLGDSISAVSGLGRERPLLAWPLTLSMLGLAGIPATAGLIGKIYLIQASVEGGYAWLGIVIVIGSMISLGYYLPVIAAMWMREAPGRPAVPRPGRGRARRPARGGGRLQRDRRRGIPARARPPARDRLRGRPRGRGDARLRDRAPAAVRPGAAHRVGARAVVRAPNRDCQSQEGPSSPRLIVRRMKRSNCGTVNLAYPYSGV